MAERIMYVKPGCPYCDSARERLRGEGLGWEERDATTRGDWREELFSYSPRGVVPTIVESDGAVTIGVDGRG
jgi:glutaredoxin